MSSRPVNDIPHTFQDQLKILEGLLKVRRQEQLQGDQSDVDFALGSDNVWSGSNTRLVLPLEGDQ